MRRPQSQFVTSLMNGNAAWVDWLRSTGENPKAAATWWALTFLTPSGIAARSEYEGLLADAL